MNKDLIKRFQKPKRRAVKTGGSKKVSTSLGVSALRSRALRELARRTTQDLRPAFGPKYETSVGMIINDALDQYEPLTSIEQQLNEEQRNERKGGES